LNNIQLSLLSFFKLIFKPHPPPPFFFFGNDSVVKVMFGKWNIGHCNSKYLPSERGFDHFIGYLGPGHGYYDHISGHAERAFDLIESVSFTNSKGEIVSSEWHSGEQYAGTYDTLLYRDKAVSSLKKHASAYPDNAVPLFMWSAQHGVHGEEDIEPEVLYLRLYH